MFLQSNRKNVKNYLNKKGNGKNQGKNDYSEKEYNHEKNE
jgi:hypothetical protein